MRALGYFATCIAIHLSISIQLTTFLGQQTTPVGNLLANILITPTPLHLRRVCKQFRPWCSRNFRHTKDPVAQPGVEGGFRVRNSPPEPGALV